MSREEAVRRIEQAADQGLSELNCELDLSGLQLQEVPPEIANYQDRNHEQNRPRHFHRCP